MTKRNGL